MSLVLPLSPVRVEPPCTPHPGIQWMFAPVQAMLEHRGLSWVHRPAGWAFNLAGMTAEIECDRHGWCQVRVAGAIPPLVHYCTTDDLEPVVRELLETFPIEGSHRAA